MSNKTQTNEKNVDPTKVGAEQTDAQKAIGEKRFIDALDRPVQPRPDNITIEQAMHSVQQAMGCLAHAFTQDILIPDNDGEEEVTVEVDPATGEVDTYHAKAINRFFRMQRGMLNQVMRQLDYEIGAQNTQAETLAKQQASMLNNLQRSEDPTKLRRAIEVNCDKIDAARDRQAWAVRLRDAAFEAYLDLCGEPYVPYEKKAAPSVKIPVATQHSDPLLARVAAQRARS